MITLFLDQTPSLLHAMDNYFKTKEWDLFQATVHKMIPSFVIMGISSEYEDMARNIQEYKGEPQTYKKTTENIKTIATICQSACNELTEEYKRLNISWKTIKYTSF